MSLCRRYALFVALSKAFIKAVYDHKLIRIAVLIEEFLLFKIIFFNYLSHSIKNDQFNKKTQ